jgi:hypothetical protein
MPARLAPNGKMRIVTKTEQARELSSLLTESGLVHNTGTDRFSKLHERCQ